jgi:hypothetical protein
LRSATVICWGLTPPSLREPAGDEVLASGFPRIAALGVELAHWFDSFSPGGINPLTPQNTFRRAQAQRSDAPNYSHGHATASTSAPFRSVALISPNKGTRSYVSLHTPGQAMSQLALIATGANQL